LEWIGHLVRIFHRIALKKIFQSKSEERIRMERPILRYLDGIEKDLWEINVNKWRRKAVDRKKCASVIKESKALRGLQSN
jgi:hypothetical protein